MGKSHRSAHSDGRIRAVFALLLWTWCYATGAQVATTAAPSAPGQEQPLSQSEAFFLKEFLFTGNTVFSTAQLAESVAGFTNRTVTLDELEDARRAVTMFYVNHGYINSGAVLEDQVIKDGTVTFRIIEGRISEIHLHRPKPRLSEKYLTNRIGRAIGPPLLMPRLQERLLLIRDNPNIEQINAELEPGLVPGESILDVRVRERNPWRFGFEVRNDRPPSVGGQILDALVSDENVTGHSDRFDLHWGLVEGGADGVRASGVDNLGFSYALPVTSRDTTVQVGYQRNNYVVTEQAFSALNIQGESESFSGSLRQPLLQEPDQEMALSLQADHEKTRSFLDGVAFSFSPGSVNGESVVNVLRVVHEYLKRTQQQVFAFRSSFNLGLNILDSTENRTHRDSSFFGWSGQMQYVRRLDERGDQVILRGGGQWANDPLLSPEQFSIGGIRTVRGYYENQLVRDIGFATSLEFRIPLLYSKQNAAMLQLAPFFDYGAGWNVETTTPLPHDLASAGVGLILTPNPKFTAQLYWGHPFRDLNTGHSDPQDFGLHFSVRWMLL